MRHRSRGFTLIEVVVSLVILGVISMGITKMLTSQGRYYDHETNLRQARSVSRSSMNILLSDLRMVQDSGGIDSAAADGKLIRVLVPYRFGLVCGTNASTTTVSMLPADSADVAQSVYAGFAWRGVSGRYTYVIPNNPTAGDAPSAASSPGLCTGAGAGQAQLRTVALHGRTGDLLDLHSSGPTGAIQAAPVFFWQRVTYEFAASGIYSGKIGLFRNVQGGGVVNSVEEIMAPFDTSARFKFYKAGEDTSRTAVPALSDIRGIDIVLNALSATHTSDDAHPSQSKITTSVFFKNVRAF